MPILTLVILAVIHGLAELLPVSSSAHVIVAAKLLGLDPTAPEMTLLLVALHSGTMLAVIVYFWRAWLRTYFSSWDAFRRIAARLVCSTVLTAAVGYPIVLAIEKAMSRSIPNADVELVFGNLALTSRRGCSLMPAEGPQRSTASPSQSSSRRPSCFGR